MDDHPAPAMLRLADGAVLVIEQLPDGQIKRTRIEPDGTTSIELRVVSATEVRCQRN